MAAPKRTAGARRKLRSDGIQPVTAVTAEEPALEGMGSKLGHEIYRFVGDLEAQVETLFKTLTASTGIEAKRLQTQALAKLGLAKAIAASLKNGALDKGHQYATEADRYVRDQPWRAIGIGAAVGFTAGALLARRNAS